MKLLRDTHTFLWFIDDSPLLSARGKALLEADNDAGEAAGLPAVRCLQCPMRPNPLAPWERRIGTLRVYSDVEDTPEPKVYMRAVGIKERQRVRMAGAILQL